MPGRTERASARRLRRSTIATCLSRFSFARSQSPTRGSMVQSPTMRAPPTRPRTGNEQANSVLEHDDGAHAFGMAQRKFAGDETTPGRAYEDHWLDDLEGVQHLHDGIRAVHHAEAPRGCAASIMTGAIDEDHSVACPQRGHLRVIDMVVGRTIARLAPPGRGLPPLRRRAACDVAPHLRYARRADPCRRFAEGRANQLFISAGGVRWAVQNRRDSGATGAG